jgi:hypothetical protein
VRFLFDGARDRRFFIACSNTDNVNGLEEAGGSLQLSASSLPHDEFEYLVESPPNYPICKWDMIQDDISHSSRSSFVQEFVADPLDGITLLLDLLRAIQLSQSTNHNGPAGNNTTGKMPPSLQRRALLDELSCLQCLLLCCQRYTESIRKLTASSAGLFTLAICIMSNVTKSRILSLQLLTKACQPSNNGHSAVSEALSTLRLRFGEPVRFRFLVGMLMSAGGQGDLLVAGMRFLNTFLDTAGTMQKRLYIQAELEQAGFDVATVKKVPPTTHSFCFFSYSLFPEHQY